MLILSRTAAPTTHEEKATMMKQLTMLAAASMLSLSAFAIDHAKVEQKFELKDGSTVYVLKDGKMAMENKHGQPLSMKDGHIMETKDGQKVMMKGNEFWRLEEMKRQHNN